MAQLGGAGPLSFCVRRRSRSCGTARHPAPVGVRRGGVAGRASAFSVARRASAFGAGGRAPERHRWSRPNPRRRWPCRSIVDRRRRSCHDGRRGPRRGSRRLTSRCSGPRTAATLCATIQRRSGGAGPLSFGVRPPGLQPGWSCPSASSPVVPRISSSPVVPRLSSSPVVPRHARSGVVPSAAARRWARPTASPSLPGGRFAGRAARALPGIGGRASIVPATSGLRVRPNLALQRTPHRRDARCGVDPCPAVRVR